MVLKRFFFMSFLLFSFVFAQKSIGVYEQQGNFVPLELSLINEYNQPMTLQQAIGNKPTILTINYFDCPTLCSPLQNNLASTLNKMQLKPFLEYRVITLSIHPQDTPKHALKKKKSLLNTFNRPFPPQTWSFLTTTQENIHTITQAVGFKYEKRIKEGVVDYLHPGLIVLLSPKGKITRYLNGIEYLPFDLKLGLLEASKGEVRPTITKTLLYCFAYDAKSKTYVFQAEKVVGSFIFGIVLLFFIYLLKTGRKDKS